MDRRTLMIAVSALPLAACTTTGTTPTDPAARNREMDARVGRALSDLSTQVPASQQLVSQAKAVLVFPNVVSAGLGIGGTFGEGVLRKRGATVGHYTMAGGSVGLIAGAQSRAVFLLFMTDDALQKFEASSGWTAGVDANVAAGTAGATAQATTQTVQQPVVSYVVTNAGLMANVSLDGTKITKRS
jgi:lipid-binding SYLF domain-containing protein